MTKLAWATDLHLDHIRAPHPSQQDESVRACIKSLRRDDVDGYVVTGDISTSPLLRKHLLMLEEGWQKPIYFVLGNHDFWHSQIYGIRAVTELLSIQSEYLRYMTPGAGMTISQPNLTALVGHDGWYDGLNGNGEASTFIMNDWRLIKEYQSCSWRPELIQELSEKLAREATQKLSEGIQWAIQSEHHKIVILTHVPPWTQAHFHEGLPGDAEAHPWYTSKLMGDYLNRVALNNLDREFLVLCGHTHGAADVQIHPNMRCIVGGTDYGAPKIQQVFEF